MNTMEEATAIRLKAGQRAIEKLIEEHRKSGEPMVISPEPDLIQWVVPQADGTMKVVKERRLNSRGGN